MKPPCYNRPPMLPGTWEFTGRRVPDMLRQHSGRKKPVLRWRWSAFEDRCTQWDGQGIGPNNECYAEANKFDCRGCMHIPPKAARFLHRKTIGEAIDRNAWDHFIESMRRPAFLAQRAVDNLVDSRPLIPIRMVTDLDQIDEFNARPWAKLEFAEGVDGRNSELIAHYKSGTPEGAKDLTVSYSLCHDIDNPTLIQN